MHTIHERSPGAMHRGRHVMHKESKHSLRKN